MAIYDHLAIGPHETVLKSVNKWEQLESMQHWKKTSFQNKNHPTLAVTSSQKLTECLKLNYCITAHIARERILG